VSRSILRFAIVLTLGFWLCGSCLPVRAQTNSPIPLNPQLQLILAQPLVDITTPVTATASFDPPVVGVGEKAVYRVTFSALEASLRWPPKIPAPAGLNMTPSAQGQTMQVIGNTYRPLTSVNYHAHAGRPGFFTMPAFWVEVYGKPVLVPEARLEVAEKLDAAHEPARQLLLEPASTNLFVGEMLGVRVLAPGSLANVVEALATLEFNGDGFFADKSNGKQSIERLEVSGRVVATFVAEANVIPIAAGEQTLTVHAFTSGAQFNGPVVIHGQATIPGGTVQPVLLDSDPVVIQVRPLPAGGASGFTGFIGNLTVDPPQLSTNKVRVGDPFKLFVTFRSDGNLARFVPPPPPRVAGWQIFPAMPAEPMATTPPTAPPANGGVTFAYTMIPMTEEPHTTPAIPFSCFNPQKAAFGDLTIPGVALTIVAEGLPAETSAAIWSAANETTPAKKSSLSQLAGSRGKTLHSLVPLQMQKWFLIVQLLPACALAALWDWDRRRRFRAAHPEIVRRRQALRALRREKRVLRCAVASGDAPGFIRSGVTALQIAAAPHYPAEPRALVCGEVLNLFSDNEREGRMGEVIRQFFVRQAAASFAPSRENPSPLFDLRAELERILQQLEARL
ncbi:MAG TPA: BatD family protein, partial [Verrucomicrobiae bacterium]